MVITRHREDGHTISDAAMLYGGCFHGTIRLPERILLRSIAELVIPPWRAPHHRVRERLLRICVEHQRIKHARLASVLGVRDRSEFDRTVRVVHREHDHRVDDRPVLPRIGTRVVSHFGNGYSRTAFEIKFDSVNIVDVESHDTDRERFVLDGLVRHDIPAGNGLRVVAIHAW
ncbi:MAG: hypothetical protein ACFHWZ_09710 [Phycisphaerales bacterium]